MAIVINGGVNDDGDINYLGYLFNYSYHAQCLIDYAIKKYPNINGFKELDYMEDPNAPIYYLSLLNNIVFTNVSSDDEKRGVLYLPKEISEKQLDMLYGFASTVSNFDISIVYDMYRIDGTTIGEAFDLNKRENLKEKLDDFVLQKFKKGEIKTWIKR